jgi:uncharacterized protein YbjT (DUF2867 family)
MKNVIITGATGMVGGIVLRECLKSLEIGKVTSIVRHSSGVNHPKLEEVIHSDFMNYKDSEYHFENIDIAYFCIGVYSGSVPDNKFKQITVDFTTIFADVLKQKSPNATFCLLSGQGADQTEKSRMSFAKYKGMAENYLIKQDFGNLYIFRPAYIYPVEPRQEPNFMYRVSRKLYPLLKNIFPSTVITSEQLGKAIFKAGIKGAEKMVLENQDIKKI